MNAIALLGVILCALAFCAHATAQRPHEQTVTVERLAQRLARAKVIHPTTERTVRALIEAMQGADWRQDPALDRRLTLAIAAIEQRLAQPDARRQASDGRHGWTVR